MQEKIRFSPPSVRQADALSPDQFWKTFYRMSPAQFYPAGAEMFRQDNRAEEVYLLHSGLVKLVYVSDNGKESITGLRSRPSLIGADAVLLNRRHQVSAITLNDCAARRLPAAGFIELMQSDAELIGECLRSQSLEHREQVLRLAQMTSVSATARLEHLIRQLIDVLGMRADGKRLRFQSPLTQGEIGSLIGVDTTYVCKLMGRLEREGKLLRDRGWLIILDPQKLWYQQDF